MHKKSVVTLTAVRVGSVIFGCATKREICHFYHIIGGLGKKIKSNSGLFECQFHEIEVNANTVGNGSASCIINNRCISLTHSSIEYFKNSWRYDNLHPYRSVTKKKK